MPPHMTLTGPHLDWLTLAIGIVLIVLGVYYFRRAEVSAEEARARNWRISAGAYRVMAVAMIVAGSMDIGALIVMPLMQAGA